MSGAARAAPIAILVGVGATQAFGWLILIAASFATTSVSDLLGTALPLPMGQLFLNVLGKRGMLAIWSFIIVVQVIDSSFWYYLGGSSAQRLSNTVRDRRSSRR